MYLGFDRLGYPGDAVMASLWSSTPMRFVAVYLAPAPSQGSTAWMPHVPDLLAAGWGIAPVYVGQQALGGPGSHTLTAAAGATDAADAGSLAASAGLPAGSTVYLDIEAGGLIGADFLSYVGAWVAGMQAGAYQPGVYCSFSQTSAQVRAAVGDIPIWVFHPRDAGPSTVDLAIETPPDPGTSGDPQALVWQYRMSLSGSVDITWTDVDGTPRSLAGVDLDAAVFPDPSHPALPTPAVTGAAPGAGTAGDTIDVTGTDFIGIVDVAFGTVSAPNMVVVSPTELQATLPANLSGQTLPIVVTNRWGNQSPPTVSVGIDITPG